MNPYAAYQQNRDRSQTRIDSILALYEHGIQRLEKAVEASRRKDQLAVQRILAPVHLIITALASGIDEQAGEMGVSFLKLFDFVVHCLKSADQASLEGALRVLRTLHEGFQTIRPEAVQMERSGEIRSLDRVRALEASA